MKSNFEKRKARKEIKTRGILKELINKGAINQGFKGFVNCMHWLCSNKNPTIEMIDLLLDNEIQLNAYNPHFYHGKTELHLLCSRVSLTKDNQNIILYLIQKGCNPFLQTLRRNSCFDLLIQKSRLALCHKLLIVFFETETNRKKKTHSYIPPFLRLFTYLKNRDLEMVDEFFETYLKIKEDQFKKRSFVTTKKQSNKIITIPFTLLDLLILCLEFFNKNNNNNIIINNSNDKYKYQNNNDIKNNYNQNNYIGNDNNNNTKKNNNKNNNNSNNNKNNNKNNKSLYNDYLKLIYRWVDKIIKVCQINLNPTPIPETTANFQNVPTLHFLFNKKTFNKQLFDYLISKGLDIDSKHQKKHF